VSRRLHDAGYAEVSVKTRLRPAWTSDWITAKGRAALAEHGIAAPNAAPRRRSGPVPLVLSTSRPYPGTVPCPRCASTDTEQTSRFAATACKALWGCRACREPFEYFKEI
jgi:ring-1,2-phenylacetyl-CoA epoxidase subunit PaaD